MVSKAWIVVLISVELTISVMVTVLTFVSALFKVVEVNWDPPSDPTVKILLGSDPLPETTTAEAVPPSSSV